MEKNELNKFLQSFADFLANKSTPFLLLIGSFVLVALSIIHGKYFFETFLTLIYAVGATYLIIVRKQASIGNYIVKTKGRLFIYLAVFIVWFSLWMGIVLRFIRIPWNGF